MKCPTCKDTGVVIIRRDFRAGQLITAEDAAKNGSDICKTEPLPCTDCDGPKSPASKNG